MTAADDILGTIPTLQSTALVGHNIAFVKKKRKKVSDFANVGVTNIVGTSLTKDVADFINS